MRKNILLILLVCLTPYAKTSSQKFQAQFTKHTYTVKQGRTIRAQIKTSQPVASGGVRFLSKNYSLHPVPNKPLIYECFIPIECEGTHGTQKLLAKVRNQDKTRVLLKRKVNITKETFPKSKGFKISFAKLKSKVEKESRNKGLFGKRGELSNLIKKFIKKSPKKRMWGGAFKIPTKVNRYSTPFGEIRHYPHWGRYLHKGVDIVGPPRYNVWASQNGKVIIKKRFKFGGNTVVLDHGLGIFTYYLHLDKFANIKEGSYVKKGQKIGTIGNTGYSTGFHLHWSLSIQDKLVDPVEWTTKKFI